MKMTVIAMALSIVALGAFWAACSSGSGQRKVQAGVAADFRLNDIAGKAVSLAEFKGKRPVLVHFGATWCPFCHAQVPPLGKLREKYTAEELAILSVDPNEAADVVRKYVSDNSIKYTMLVDGDGKVADLYGVTGVPQNFLVDRDGNIVARGVPLPESDIAKLVGR